MNAGSVGMVGLMASNPGLPAEEAGSKKIRKPYTITKSRESWTEQEHDKFLEALQLFDRDWKKIEAFVGSKTVIQIRSHAQKYFLKVQKNGTGEHVPPPRPKRKSTQPYPQKAAKAAPAPQNSRGISTPLPGADYGYMIGAQQCNLYVPGVPWVHHSVPPGGVPFSYKDGGQQAELASPTGMNKSLTSSGSSPCWPQNLPTQQTNERAAPAFSEVYRFIGSIFDPEVTGHLKRLREMAPIDKETVLLLMRNLAINLSSPGFDEQKFISSEYEFNPRDDNSNLATSNPATLEPEAKIGFCKSSGIPGEEAGADVSKHPYDGGGGEESLDYISEVLDGSQMDLAFSSQDSQQQQQQQQRLIAAASSPDESYELGVETRLLSAEDDENVDRWWRP